MYGWDSKGIIPPNTDAGDKQIIPDEDKKSGYGIISGDIENYIPHP